MLPVQSCLNILLFVLVETAIDRPDPVPARGALRDRHERWVWDAMDAKAHETNAPIADGEVVWFWHLDADAKLATMLWHRADDGDKQARSPGRARRNPLKPSRRECSGAKIP